MSHTIHALTIQQHKIFTRCYFILWLMWSVVQKQQSKCYTWIESGPQNVARPNRSDVGPERSRNRTWTCTKTSFSVEL